MEYFIYQEETKDEPEVYWGMIEHNGSFEDACKIFFNAGKNNRYNEKLNTLDYRLLFQGNIKLKLDIIQ